MANKFIEEIKKMSVIELNDLVKAIEEEFGVTAFILTYDLMGEDMVQNEEGSGWFYYDYVYNVKSDYTHKSGRPYSVWYFYYTVISNTNAIIAAEAPTILEVLCKK